MNSKRLARSNPASRLQKASWRLIEKLNPEKIGAPPGTPIHVGSTPDFEPFISLIQFSPEDMTEWIHIDPQTIGQQILSKPTTPQAGTDRVSWIDMEGVHNVGLVSGLGQVLELHALTIEDIVNCNLRPQFQPYPGYFFFALKMIYITKTEGERTELICEQLNVVLKGQTLVTFQEKPGDNFGRIRDRIRTKTGKIRNRGADHLLYALLDTVVDGYLQVVDHVAEKIERLEDDLRASPRASHLTRIYELKREILWLRKNIFPVRDMLNKVQVEQSVFQDNTKLYLRDLLDHVTQVTDSLSMSFEMVAVLLDTWHSLNNQKMNAIMKTLTMISTVFLPLNFIAGIYGMNFAHMPELQNEWGYPAVLALMFFVAVFIVGFFVQKGWLWEKREPGEVAN